MLELKLETATHEHKAAAEKQAGRVASLQQAKVLLLPPAWALLLVLALCGCSNAEAWFS